MDDIIWRSPFDPPIGGPVRQKRTQKAAFLDETTYDVLWTPASRAPEKWFQGARYRSKVRVRMDEVVSITGLATDRIQSDINYRL